MDQADEELMRRALALAREAAEAGEAPIGALVFDPATGEVIATGRNAPAGAISHARIGRVVFGAEDAKGGAVVHGPRYFEQPTCHSRPAVTGGVLAEESATMLRDFFRARRR